MGNRVLYSAGRLFVWAMVLMAGINALWADNPSPPVAALETAGDSLSRPDKTPPMAKKGILDLRGWDLEKDGPIELNGEWEFYWKQLLEPGDFHDANELRPRIVALPSSWIDYVIDGKKAGRDGHATYRLLIRHHFANREVAIYINHIRFAYKVYIDGRLLRAVGTVAPGPQMKMFTKPGVVSFIPRENSSELVLQVSNYSFRRGGIDRPLLLGDASRIRGEYAGRLQQEYFFCGALLIMGLYFLGVFIILPRDKSSVCLGIICLLSVLRISSTGEYLLASLFPWLSGEVLLKIEYLSGMLQCPLGITFVYLLFPEDSSRIIVRLLQGIGILYALFLLVTPARLASQAIGPMQITLVLPTILYSIYPFILASIRRRRGARIFLVGSVILALLSSNDILNFLLIIHTGDFFYYGWIFLLFCLAIMITWRFSGAFITAERLSVELETKNRELDAKNADLQRLDKLKDEFLSNTSHELRTPLTGIIGITESLMDGARGALSDQVRSDLSLIAASGRRLSALVNDILDFSRMKNHDLTIQRRLVDMRQLAEVVLTLTGMLAGEKPVVFKNEIPADLPFAWGDENRLQQILYNLVGNAVKFTEEGTITIRASVNGGFIHVAVADTGIGIPEDRLEDIFKSFEQVDASISRKYGGTGLGLSITRELVTLHGGTIRARSAVGKGSTFTFTIPIAGELLQKPEGVASATFPGATVFRDAAILEERYDEKGKALVLVVDDEPVNLRVIAGQLATEGFGIITAADGIEALEILQRGKVPDIIILDIMMPRMSGYEVCRLLRKTHSLYDLPVLMLTAKNQILDVVAGFEAGANDYLIKPFDRRELLSRVDMLLTLKRAVLESNKLLIMEKEIEVARRIQQSILPETPPKLRDFHIVTFYSPMNAVGGDFFDFMAGDYGLGIIVGDVSGHGVPAALIAAMLKVSYSLQHGNVRNPVRLLRDVNEIMKDKCGGNFVTAGYAFIDQERRTLSYSNAGHPPLAVMKGDGEVRFLRPKGRVIGVWEEINNSLAEIPLERGDRIILYTDGITECRNKEGIEFEQDFYELIKETHGKSIDVFVEELLKQLHQWRGQEAQEDDIALIVMDFPKENQDS